MFRASSWQNGFFADFYFWTAGFFRGFCRRIFFSFLWEKVPRKILQENPRQNPPKFIQQKSSDTFLQIGRAKNMTVLSLRRNGKEESRLLNLRRLRSSRSVLQRSRSHNPKHPSAPERSLSETPKRDNIKITNVRFGGGWGRENCPKTLFFLGNTMTIKF